jgi:hypothetical protein
LSPRIQQGDEKGRACPPKGERLGTAVIPAKAGNQLFSLLDHQRRKNNRIPAPAQDLIRGSAGSDNYPIAINLNRRVARIVIRMRSTRGSVMVRQKLIRASRQKQCSVHRIRRIHCEDQEDLGRQLSCWKYTWNIEIMLPGEKAVPMPSLTPYRNRCRPAKPLQKSFSGGQSGLHVCPLPLLS